MLVAKQVADLITYSRLLMAVVLVLDGLVAGAAGLPLAAFLLLLDWAGDILDGPLARRSRRKYRTWIGNHDLEVDMAFAIGLLLYMMLAGLVSPWLAGMYGIVWATYFWRAGLPRSMGMLFQAPIYAWFLWLALHQAPAYGIWLVALIALAVIVTWPKFPKEVVPGFLSGMREVVSRRRTPRV